MKRTLFIAAAFTALTLTAGGARPAAAQAYPARPIRLIVPFPAGGPADFLARLMGQKMAGDLGQQIVVENRPGGNTIIGAELVAKAAPDGYTLLMPIDSTLTMNQFLYSKLPYDPEKDFAPISITALSPIIMESDAATGPKSIRELIADAKANPGKLTFGAGTVATQLAGELFKSKAGINLVYVGYKGSAPTVQGLLSKEVTIIIDGVTSDLPHIQAGTFRLLATMGTAKIAALPNAPLIASEANLPGFDVAVWMGLVAPAKTPAAVVERLHQETQKIMAEADVKEKLEAAGLVPAASASPAAFAAFIHGEAAKWAPVIKQTGLHFE